jgi:cell division protein
MKNNTTPTKKFRKPRIALGFTLIFLSVILIISFISYLMSWRENQSQIGNFLDKEIKSTNIFGKMGDWLGNVFIFESVGISAFIVAFLLFVFGTLILGFKLLKPWKTISHSFFFLAWLPVFIGAITKGNGILSGVFGYQIYDYGSSIIGSFGLWTCIILSFALYFILEFNISLSNITDKVSTVKEKIQSIKDDIQEEIKEMQGTEEKDEDEEGSINTNPISVAEPVIENNVKENPTTEEVETEVTEPIKASTISVEIDDEFLEKKEESSSNEKPENETDTEIITNNEPKKDDDIEITIEPSLATNNIITDPDKKADELVEKHGLYDQRLDLANFQMPSLDLLKDYGNEEITINREELEQNKNKIVEVLKNFNVGVSKIKATIGPTVTLYEIVPESGTRIATIKRLQDDIALSLSALGIRIIAPIPGKGTVGIEVPRQTPAMVSMRSALQASNIHSTDMDLPVVFGKTISNEIFMADLSKMPHLLIAGATGQGKSVGINAILTSLLYKKHPSELKFVMVDPKKVELSIYSKIERHYLAKLPDTEKAILTDNSKVINTLNSLCIEMDNRYKLLEEAFCRNLKEYNKKFKERKLNPENGHCYLPYIVLVVDEFADLIMTAGKEVEHPIARLAQLARAVGIHLIIATQRPSVNVITGMIKANFPARVAFRVMSNVDSRTILDSTGADQLIGKGDMLYSNGNDMIRIQCAFIDTPEVEKVVTFIGEQKGYPNAYELPEYVGENESSGAGNFDANEKDALFEEAARIVVNTQQGSTSMLQRQLKLGYNRAGRIMDQLENAGVVGSFNGAKAREVLISDIQHLEQFLESLRNN